MELNCFSEAFIYLYQHLCFCDPRFQPRSVVLNSSQIYENRRLDCPTAKSVPQSLVAPWLVALTMPVVRKVAERQAEGRLQAHWMQAGRAQTP